ncbi:MAG: UPF0179 family protein [Candidatus Methanomethylophilaceae archaeon]|nr:UPF0179 family protein [Candidatus Methanomethylophilaceae archaeon]
MVLITLVGETQAKIGNRFYFMGPQTDCKECRLRGVCFNLEPGRQYEIISIRDTKHECEIHEDGVRVVEVEKKPTLACIPKKVAIEGSVITYDESDCGRMGCEHWQHCHPIGIKAGEKLSVSDIVGKVDCPIRDDLMLAKLG